MPIAGSFRELIVYQEAKEAAHKIFLLSRKFPAEERYSLRDQIRRASRAVKAMIAEAWGRRRYNAVFINKLDEALGEATVTQSWLDDALAADYLPVEEFSALDSRYVLIAQRLSRMIDRAEDFCKHAPSTNYRSLPPRVRERQSLEEMHEELNEFFC
jgi:four helix bundle protein